MKRYGRSCVLLVLALAATGCGRSVGGDADSPTTDDPAPAEVETDPSPDPESAAAARIACADDRSQVLTPSVAARADGVRLQVENSADGDRSIYLRRGGEIVLVHHAPPGSSDTVTTEPPGQWEVTCVPPASHPDENSEWVPLEVTDSEQVWVPAAPDCEQPSRTDVDYFAEPQGRPGDPVDLAAEDLANEVPGWSPDDVLEPAGYPEAIPRLVRMVRHGAVVAVAEYLEGTTGGWYLNSFLYCDNDTSRASKKRRSSSSVRSSMTISSPDGRGRAAAKDVFDAFFERVIV